MARPPQYDYLENITNLYINHVDIIHNSVPWMRNFTITLSEHSFIKSTVNFGSLHQDSGATDAGEIYVTSDLLSVKIDGSDNLYQLTITPVSTLMFYSDFINYQSSYRLVRLRYKNTLYENYDSWSNPRYIVTSDLPFTLTFTSVGNAINYVWNNFANVLIYVNGEYWAGPTPPVTYNWQSVPSISGKNGILKLVKLASDAINDGNPVSGATTSAFNVLPSSNNNIRSLVNLTLEPMSTDNAVTITYNIPAMKNDSYSSVKLYAKIGEVPKCNETDDIVEDIDPTINEISLENLEYETEYFFCIQSISNNGLKLSSNVVSITTGENPAPEDIRPYLAIINGTGLNTLQSFWFSDYPSQVDYGSGLYYYSLAHPFYNYSWFAFCNNENLDVIPFNSDNGWFYETDILDIYVTSENNTYSYNISFNRTKDACKDTYWGYDRIWPGLQIYLPGARTYEYSGLGNGMSNPTSFHTSATGTATSVFSHMASRFRNVNIYLNGKLISKANNH